MDADVVEGETVSMKGDLEGLVAGAVLAKQLDLGVPKPSITSIPIVILVILGSMGLAVTLTMAGCIVHLVAPDKVGPGFCGAIDRRVKMRPGEPWEAVAFSFVLDLLLVTMVIGIISGLVWDWVGRHGLPFSLALSVAGDSFSGEKMIVRKVVRLKRNMTLQVGEDEIPHGYGEYRFAEGHAVTGSWVRGQLNGRGIFKHRDGDRYEGEFQNGLPGGVGTYTWHDGTEYSGEFTKGKPHGKGTKKWMDGDWYEGEWARGRPNGDGVYQWASGRRYEGKWRDGKMEGHGKCNFINGDVYDGNWRQDKKHGKGVYTWADGTSHEGEW